MKFGAGRSLLCARCIARNAARAGLPLRMKREQRGFIAGGAKQGLNLRGRLDMRFGAFRAHCIHLRECLRREILPLNSARQICVSQNSTKGGFKF